MRALNLVRETLEYLRIRSSNFQGCKKAQAPTDFF